MVRRQLLTPVTTWHTQTGLILISGTWGMSYLVPPEKRIPFSEVFPPSLEQNTSIPMWGWGAYLVAFALLALAAERWIIHSDGEHALAWRAAWLSHVALAACYSTLALAALVTGSLQVHVWYDLICAISRPVLWGYLAYLHVTFANLRRPVSGKPMAKTLN